MDLVFLLLFVAGEDHTGKILQTKKVVNNYCFFIHSPPKGGWIY